MVEYQENEMLTNEFDSLDNIGWYPGHMAKAKRFIAANMSLVDMVVEIRDARIPMSSANPNIKKLIGDKKHVVLLSKATLADMRATDAWINYFRSQGSECIAIDCKTLMGLDNFIKCVPNVMAEKLEFYKRKGMNKPIRAMVLGVTNVGKSTFFNAISRTKKAKVENRPGVTRTTQWVKTPYNLELLDTPGLLWEKIDSKETAFKLAVTGAIRDEVFNTIEVSWMLCKKLAENYPELLKTRFKLDDIEGEGNEIFERIGRKRGFLLSGGVIDDERTAACLLDEFRKGKIGRISLERP